MKNILFAASECVPFIKTGGLADVCGALPKMIDKDEYDVRVIIPNYTCIPERYRNEFEYVHHFYMDFGSEQGHEHVGIMTYKYEGITYYFVDNLHYFAGDKPYGTTRFDIEKFSFFCKAVLAIMPVINFKPDVIHCHDWQSGLIPVYLKTIYKDNPFYWGTRTVMTIHNLAFQGIWDIKTIRGITGLPDYLFTPDKLEYKKDANMLKGGLVYCDYITTVSDTYAGEIQQPYYGEGLDGLLRARNQSLCGIVNGIDYAVFNPETDPNLPVKYNTRNYKKNKAKCKAELQAELGLEVNPDKFLICIISRLTDQKGLDLVEWAMRQICDDNTQFAVLGTGDKKYEDLFRYYQWNMPEKVSANIYFSDALAHKLYAGCDAVLMPSRFEPCGLTQLIALKYGTIPIVRETGGLKDTVEPYNKYENTGTGFSFANYNAEEMLNAVNYAKKIYFEQRDNWNAMMVRGMKMDYSWRTSSEKYIEVYKKLTW